MAIARAQALVSNPASANNDFATTTGPAATFASTPTQGNLLVARIYNTTGGPTVTPPAGWSTAVALSGSFSIGRVGIYYKIAGASESKTVTFTTTNGTGALVIEEYSGIVGSSPLDQTGSNERASGGTSLAVSTSGATSQASELAVVAYVTSGGDGTASWTNSVTTDFDSGSGAFGSVILSSTATITTTATWVTNGLFASAVIATFKALVAATSASAGNAAGTGTAYDATTSVAGSAGSAAGTVAAYDAKASAAASAGNAAATGAAGDTASTVQPPSGAATGTGSAGNAAGSVGAGPSAATGTGSARTPSETVAASIGNAAGAGAAANPTVTTGSNTNASATLATGTGSAFTAANWVKPTAGNAAGTGTAPGAAAPASPVAGLCAGSGDAGQPSTYIAPGVIVGTGTFAAYDAHISTVLEFNATSTPTLVSAATSTPTVVVGTATSTISASDG